MVLEAIGSCMSTGSTKENVKPHLDCRFNNHLNCHLKENQTFSVSITRTHLFDHLMRAIMSCYRYSDTDKTVKVFLF